MRFVLTTLSLGLLLLAGCGASTRQDPFLGTWRPVDGVDASGSLIVSKSPRGYEAYFVRDGGVTTGALLLQRSGDALVFPEQEGFAERRMFTYDEGNQRLSYLGSQRPIQFRLDDLSTAHPSSQ